MTPLIEFRNIVKTFGGVHAVENVSLDLGEGEVLGLLGHNGAGKSTLIKILSGVFTPDSGEIRFAGKPVANSIDSRCESSRHRNDLPDPGALGQSQLGRQLLPRAGAHRLVGLHG